VSGGYSSNPHAAWTIHWASHPSKCLSVVGNVGNKGGAPVNFESCFSNSPDHQQFILPPPNSKGEIKWAKNPELCLENPIGGFLRLLKCSTSKEEKRLFMLSADGAAPTRETNQQIWRIHLAAQPSKCLDIPKGFAGNRAQLWDCDEHKANTAVQPLRWRVSGSVSFRVSYV